MPEIRDATCMLCHKHVPWAETNDDGVCHVCVLVHEHAFEQKLEGLSWGEHFVYDTLVEAGRKLTHTEVCRAVGIAANLPQHAADDASNNVARVLNRLGKLGLADVSWFDGRVSRWFPMTYISVIKKKVDLTREEQEDAAAKAIKEYYEKRGYSTVLPQLGEGEEENVLEEHGGPHRGAREEGRCNGCKHLHEGYSLRSRQTEYDRAGVRC